ncbi:MAG TPA: hypothetical protein VEU55_01285 [Gemmatimonadales bacterium]|nr:hypothetical protein [Gemmatimonadales bacterium]
MALATTALLAGYLILTLRAVPLASRGMARTVGAAAALAWYLLTYRIVKRVALQWLR